ncbi:MAG: extracellular solute-binding protein [Aestuariivirga sp.]
MMLHRTTLLMTFALAMAIPLIGPSPVQAQGMFSAAESGDPAAGLDPDSFGKPQPLEISTIQRLLRRLGYLKDADMTRKMDDATLVALSTHFKNSKTPTTDLNAEKIIRSLFTTVWTKENWASGTVNGQELVVDRAEVRSVQEALKTLGYAPGPADGVFGPATFSAIEIFQEDNGLKVSGLITRNVLQNIGRARNFAGREPAATVHVLNWPDYVDPNMLEAFEKETNIRVVHEVFENSTETKDLLVEGSGKYDLMVQPGAQMRQVLEKDGAVDVLDRSKLPNAKNLDPAVLEFTGVLDPDNAHSVTYMWGTMGLGLYKDKIKAIRPDMPFDSLGLILDPELAADVSKCGIAVVDEPIDVIPIMVAYLGGDIRSMGITDLEAVDVQLSKVAQYITVIPADRFIDTLAQGKYCAMFGYSGDIFLARDTAKADKIGTVSYVVPKEGSLLWFDLFVIPAKGQSKDAAYKLIDYMMKPEVAAANTNFLQYANPITKSGPFIEPKLLADPGLYPPKKVLERLFVQRPMQGDVEKELLRIWSKLKKG